MNRLSMLIALIATACGTGRLPAWKTHELTPAARQNVKRVVDVGQYMTTARWENSPWYRPGETLLPPIYLTYANDNTACIVPAADWAILQAGDEYPCPGSWRIPRPVR